MKNIYILFLLISSFSFAQIVQVKDIWTGVGNSSSPANLFDFSGTLLFRANDGVNGVELWKSDGTDAGTVLVKNINAGTTVSGTSNPANFTSFSGQVLFTASNGTDVNATELWKTDGTNAGTVLVKDINATAANASGNPQNFTIINPTTMLFSASDGIGGNELWKTDGSTAGTVNVIDYPGTTNSITWIENLNGTGILGQIVSNTGREIYKSDGTGANSGLVLDITTGTTGGVGTTFFKSGNVIYFGGNSGTTGTELWKTDGTTAGTVLVKDINAGTTASSPGRFAAIGSTVYFRATGANGAELWKTDGTEIGTVEVADIFSGTGSSNPDQVTSVNGAIYFFAADSATDANDLYKYDGTTLTKLADFNAKANTLSSNFVLLGTTVYFAADSKDADEFRELWQTDGTPVGTISVSSLHSPVVNPTGVSNITAVGGKLFFTAASTDGTELFKYEPVLSVSNADFAERVQVYPNPTNGKMYLNLKSTDTVYYQILDLLGKTVSEGTVNNNEIDFEAEKGVYLLKLENSEFISRQKIIKK
ncbi:ELWxxDGT repeat protein [Flavobacterium sp.]|jgi:ELWxxDGT repeat protein|uniref:ELWxxDGT repeat protein n=1 Tax=Flavobacterium sp. TaxID=239 RepID=UPI0037BFF840